MEKRYRYAWILALVGAAVAGCDDDGGDGGSPVDAADSGGSDGAGDVSADEPDGGGDDLGTGDGGEVVLGPGSLRWDLTAARTDDFFAFPWPSNARTTEEGTPDLASFDTNPATVDILVDAIELIEAGAPGFSPLGAVYFSFTESVDPGTLPADVDAGLAEDASVFILDVTPESPEYGQRRPATVAYREEAGIYWPARTLVIHPLYAVPLRTATTYAAVVTRAVHGPDDVVLAPPDVVARLDELVTVALNAEVESLRPLHAALVDESLDLGVAHADLLAATVFTTSDPMAELRELATWLRETGTPPAASEWVLATPDDGDGFEVYEADVAAWELFADEVPYRRFGEGLIAADEDGAPETPVRVTLRLAVSVPTGAPPDDVGWPVLLYSHGLGEDYRGFVRVAAAEMAARGVAVMGLDPPLQGGRNTTSQNDRDLILSLSVGNIVAGREILRQGALDTVQLEALVDAGVIIPADVASGGTAIPLDASRVAFMGHSEGAQVGALFLPLSELAQSGVFSEGGGGAALTMLSLELPEIDVAEVVAVALGIDDAIEAFDVDHPVTSAIIQPLLDPADPLHCARELFAEPRVGEPRDLLVLEGFNDALTPPVVIEAMASAARLPIAEPVARAIAGLDLQGIASTPLPAHDNLTDTQGRHATGALLQFPDEDHYIIYFNETGRTQIFDFLETALEGNATLQPPPDL